MSKKIINPANMASPPDLAIRRRKCDGGGYIVPLQYILSVPAIVHLSQFRCRGLLNRCSKYKIFSDIVYLSEIRFRGFLNRCSRYKIFSDIVYLSEIRFRGFLNRCSIYKIFSDIVHLSEIRYRGLLHRCSHEIRHSRRNERYQISMSQG